jgi:hypothetical protein
MARRLSSAVNVTDLILAMVYKRLLMHNEAAGMATERPVMNLVVISHQTGAQLTVFPSQMMALMDMMRAPVPVQRM